MLIAEVEVTTCLSEAEPGEEEGKTRITYIHSNLTYMHYTQIYGSVIVDVNAATQHSIDEFFERSKSQKTQPLEVNQRGEGTVTVSESRERVTGSREGMEGPEGVSEGREELEGVSGGGEGMEGVTGGREGMGGAKRSRETCAPGKM